MRLGSDQMIPVNIRVIAAINQILTPVLWQELQRFT